MRSLLASTLLLTFCGSLQAAPERLPAVAPFIQPTATQQVPYLTTFLKDPVYLFSYNRLMRYWGNGIPTWVRRFNELNDGVQEEVRGFRFKGHIYQIARVRKPHATDQSYLSVVFNDPETGPIAWGYYVVNGAGSWIGVPPRDLAEYVERLDAQPDLWN